MCLHARYITLVMGIKLINLKPIVAALAIPVMFSLPLQAAESVDELLLKLRNAEAAQAIQLDRAVQAEWSKTGSASMDLLLKRGRDALEVKDFPAAIEHLTALTDHAPDFPEGWHLRATAYYQSDLYGPALADLQTALRLNPDNYNAIFGLAVMLEELGDKQRAYEAYTRVRDIHPNHSELSEALARLERDVSGQSL
ncbi:MAG: tetratricopeptide repeat protein [Paracoccaceae bacterium]